MAKKESDFMYPISASDDKGWEQELGMTKREYYAAKAMQGYAGGEFTGQSGMPYEQIAEWSVRMADALVCELAKKEKDLKD